MLSKATRIGIVLLGLIPSACSHRATVPHATRTPLAPVSGSVLFTGTVPPARKIGIPPAFARSLPSGLSYQPFQVGTNGGLGDVLVFILNPPTNRPAPTITEATLSISNTICHPGFLAVYTNQPVRFRVSGGPTLNLTVTSKEGAAWNRAVIPPDEFVRHFDQPDLQIKLVDNNALWLVGRIAVFDHPWFTVTDTTGRFTLPPLPPGRYTIQAIHRRCGHQTAVIDVPSPAGASTLFRMSASAATNPQ